MTTNDLVVATVVSAIKAGHDTVDRLARHFILPKRQIDRVLQSARKAGLIEFGAVNRNFERAWKAK